ncbi:MAG: class III extradiol ring-cleavage dioxygenase [Gammaproteobacteria bacterium]
MPTFFIPHGGGPCFFMEWTMGPPDTWMKMAEFLRGLVDTLAVKPRAVLVISGHWEEAQVTVNRAANPELYFDYYGFPPHTYELTWPAPGDPQLAHLVKGLLDEAGYPCAETSDRGFDHGVFVPFKIMLPEAEIPVVQLSLLAGLDPAAHLKMGHALTPLRTDGVLIVGSGMSYHNMQALRGGGGPLDDSDQFDNWLSRACELPPGERRQALIEWSKAPSAMSAHPREEHLLPLMVAAGAAMDEPGRHIFRDRVMDATVSAFRFG